MIKMNNIQVSTSAKTVNFYDENWKFVRSYKSTLLASRDLRISAKVIRTSAENKGSTMPEKIKYRFVYDEDDNDELERNK